MAINQAKYKVVGSPGTFSAGTGNIVFGQVANPAAGTNFTLTVPEGKKWRLQCIGFSFTTSVDAGNRIVRMIIKDPSGNMLYQASTHGTQAASQTVFHNTAPYLAMLTSNAQDSTVGFPEFIYSAGQTIVSNIGGMFPTDQISNIFYSVEEWWD
jgi:hypothetical protein